jgi:CRISPR system Cascade subunit CasA
MDNMKARGWYEARMPLLQITSSFRKDYEHNVASMIKAAAQIAGNIRGAIKRAWLRRPGDVKGDVSFLGSSFWQNTEPTFYEASHGLKSALESGGDTMLIRKAWLDSLCREALMLFDAYAWGGPIEDTDPKRVAIARNELQKFNRSKKIKGLLDLPVEQQPKITAVKKKSR